MLSLLESQIMHAEEFVMIPKRMFISKNPTKEEIFDNPIYQQKATQLSLLQRSNPNFEQSSGKKLKDADTSTDGLITRTKSTGDGTSDPEDVKSELFVSDDSEIEPVVKKRKDSAFDSIMLELKLMDENKTKRAAIILKKIFDSDTVSISEENNVLHIEDEPQGVKVTNFLYNLQQPTKKIDVQKGSKILSELDIAAHLVYKSHAKTVLDEFYSEEEEEQPTRKQRNSSSNKNNQEEDLKQKKKVQSQKSKRAKRRQTKTRVEKTGLSIDDVKKLDNLYLKGPASFGNAKRLQNLSKLSMKEVKMYLETKPSFTKYRSRNLRFPRLKVIVNDLNEIWSVDLAFVYKLAKYNRGVKYLLVAVDCLSRYLRVEPLKTKYATETAEAFKKMIKHKQPKKVWVDDGTEFLGAFKDLCNKRGIHLYSTFSEKKSAFAERNIRSIKNIIYRYLEEKWTYSYLDKLDSFVKTINSRVNRTIKIAPNTVTKKDVPRLLSLIANTTFSQKPKIFVGDLVRILKKEETFVKGYKQSFTDEIFEISSIPTLNPPTYTLIDTDKEIIQGKFYQPELQLVRESPLQNAK